MAAAVNRHHECAICREKFTSPRLLPCFHTFCLACLQQLVTKGPVVRKQGWSDVSTFCCPTCRTVVNIPAGGVASLQVNFYIEAEVEGERAKKMNCDVCRKDNATRKCCDCDQFLCNTCTDMHSAIAATKSHTVLNLQAAADSAPAGQIAVRKERYCNIHKEEKLRFFCTQCTTVICRDCKLTSHDGHTTVDLSAKSAEARTLIQKVFKICKPMELMLNAALNECQTHRIQVQQDKKTLLEILRGRADTLKNEIDKALQEVERTLNIEVDDIVLTAAKSADVMTHELACFCSITDYANSVLQQGCDADVLEMPLQLKQFFGAVSPDATKILSFTKKDWQLTVQINEASKRARNSVEEKFGIGVEGGNLQCPNCRSIVPRRNIQQRNCWGNREVAEAPHQNPVSAVKESAGQYLGSVSKCQSNKVNNFVPKISGGIQKIQQITSAWNSGENQMPRQNFKKLAFYN